MTKNGSSTALTTEEIEALLSSGDDVWKERQAQDVLDLENIQEMSYVDYSNDDWVTIAAFSELISRGMVHDLLIAGGTKAHIDAVDLYNGFAMHCSAVCSGVIINADVKSFFDAVIHHYSHGKSMVQAQVSFMKALEPLFTFLRDAFRESSHDLLKVATMETSWNKLFSHSLAYDVVSERSAEQD